MSDLPIRRIAPCNQPDSSPITTQDVEDAYQAFAALRVAAQGKPALAENEYFMALQDTAFARFMLVFEAL